MKKKLAIILSRFPFPLEKGDKLRAYHQIKYLSTYFEIHLFALERHAIPEKYLQELTPFCKQIRCYPLRLTEIGFNILRSLFKGEPIQVGYFFSIRIFQAIQRDLDSLQPDRIYAQLSRTVKYVQDRNEFKVCDFQDAFSLNYHRIAKESSWLKKWFYSREANSMQHFEQQMLKSFNHCTIISARDKEAIDETITVISNGVETDRFLPIDQDKQFDLLFLGNLSYEPNQQAVKILTEEIIPLILPHYPNLKVKIAGANMPSSMLSLQNKYVTCLGWVEDIVHLYNEARVFVAPLWSGAGLQNKVLEAMSCGTPVVCTKVVNASLQAPSQAVHVAATNQEFAQQVLTLLSSEAQQKIVGQQGRDFVLANYQWNVENEKLKVLLD